MHVYFPRTLLFFFGVLCSATLTSKRHWDILKLAFRLGFIAEFLNCSTQFPSQSDQILESKLDVDLSVGPFGHPSKTQMILLE